MNLLSPAAPGRSDLRRASSLIEVLVVIVVFLVGILAVIHIFPPGLAILRQNQQRTAAQGAAAVEAARIQAPGARLPEMILPLLWQNGAPSALNPGQQWSNLLPSVTDRRLSQDGQVLLAGAPVGPWQSVTGANHFVRVIAEGGPLPAPARMASGGPGSLVSLTYGPIRYTRQALTGVGAPGDVIATTGPLAALRGAPKPEDPVRLGVAHFQEAADLAGFLGGSRTGTDALHLARPALAAAQANGFRIRCTVRHQGAGGPVHSELSLVASPARSLSLGANGYMDASADGRFWIIDLRALAADAPSHLFGDAAIPAASYISVLPEGLDVRAGLREVPLDEAFAAADPLAYKVLNGQQGSLLVNPFLSDAVAPTAEDARSIGFYADYTVLDWRIRRTDLKVPDTAAAVDGVFTVPLAGDGVLAMGAQGADGRPYRGFEVDPISSGDIHVFDPATGAVLVRTDISDPRSSYSVDYGAGSLSLGAREAGSNEVFGWFAFPDFSAPAGPPIFQRLRMNGMRLMAYTIDRRETSVQAAPAPRRFRIAESISPQGLRPGQAAIGGRSRIGAAVLGSADRIYFTPSSLGDQIIIDRIATNLGEIKGAVMRVDGFEVLGGRSYAYAGLGQVRPGASLDLLSPRPVQGVKGSGGRVRALWNHREFILGTDPAANYRLFEEWSRTWKRHEEAFFVGVQR